MLSEDLPSVYPLLEHERESVVDSDWLRVFRRTSLIRELPDPRGYGRVIRDLHDELVDCPFETLPPEELHEVVGDFFSSDSNFIG